MSINIRAVREFASFGPEDKAEESVKAAGVPDADDQPGDARMARPRQIVKRNVHYPWAQTGYDPNYSKHQTNRRDRTSRRQFEELRGRYPWIDDEFVRKQMGKLQAGKNRQQAARDNVSKPGRGSASRGRAAKRPRGARGN